MNRTCCSARRSHSNPPVRVIAYWDGASRLAGGPMQMRRMSRFGRSVLAGALVFAAVYGGPALAVSPLDEEGTPHFPGEPPRYFRTNGGQIAEYWCSEIWATRSMELNVATFPGDEDMSEFTMDARVAPSAHGLNRIAVLWTKMGAFQEALLARETETLVGHINDWGTLKAEFDTVLAGIARIEARMAKQAPILARRKKLEALGPLIGTVAGLGPQLAELETGLAEATGMWNLANRDSKGRSVDELNASIADIQKQFITARTQAITAGFTEGEPKTIADLASELSSAKAFHESELQRELRELGVPEEDLAELERLKAQRNELSRKMAEAARKAEDRTSFIEAAQLQLRQFRLVASIIHACIKDQTAWLNGNGGTGMVTLPGGEIVPVAGDVITGSFRLSCDLPNMEDPADRRVVFPVGSVVMTFRGNNEIDLVLRSPSLDGNPAHENRITGTMTFDPVTGQASGIVGAEASYMPQMFDRVSAFITNKNGRTEVSGLYCSGPKPEHMDELIAALGGSMLLTYCGGKFWGPEEMLEPSGPERDTQCGF